MRYCFGLKSKLITLANCLLLSGFINVLPAAERDGYSKGELLFSLQVKSILAEKCFACHGEDPKTVEGEFVLSSREKMLLGGESGETVLTPGKAEKSSLYLSVTWEDENLQMPPKENDRLTQEQVWAVRDWINAGAPWPQDARVEKIRAEHAQGITIATSGGLSGNWDSRRYKPEDIWAYQPLKDPAVPEKYLKGTDSKHPIDAFVNRKLDEIGLKPAPRANRQRLIRRATFDLVGLPPTPEEIADFLQDTRSDRIAFAAVVERLLASPHYGEQYGRYWLDVVRYADSSGFANDYERPNAWRYRDYVIRSLNNDKRFDQFIREQIAGDEIDPDDPEMLVAVGFLRMGPWEQTGMSVAKITRQLFLDDITDSVGQVFLSHPLQCAKCHDHKFDPIPTRDYYRIQAVFATTQFAGREAPFLEEENLSGFEQEKKYLTQRIARYRKLKKEIQDKEEQAARAWYKERNLEYAPRYKKVKQGIPEDKIAPRRIGLSPKDLGVDRICSKYITRYEWELERYESFAFSVYSGKSPTLKNVLKRLKMPANPLETGTLEQTAILIGGDPFSPSVAVKPGTMSCIDAVTNPKHETLIHSEIQHRRRDLANWIASPRNVLSTRSITNRLWQWHFGQGIAGNPNNFGATGKKPTHPELLDYLTRQFLKNDWSLKQMHRFLMSSDAYCRSTTPIDRKSLQEKDATGLYYSTFKTRRLTAEELRDSMLLVTGELNPMLGGIPIRPEMNLEAALQPRQIMGTYAPAYQPSPLPQQRHRRTIYALKIRGQRDPFLEVFNQPGPEKSCEQRESSTVSPQVFTLFNSEQTYARAIRLAKRLRDEAKSKPEIIQHAFQLCYGRPAEAEELTACLAHWQAMITRHKKISFRKKEYPAEVTRRKVDENTGEEFESSEILDIYEDFIPDLQPGDVDATTRGLAEVCLVLLNSNEFIYVP